MKKNIAIIVLVTMIAAVAAGCGETITGMSKDIKRIGKGTKTVFFRNE